jgi:hypothetical protein
MALPQRPRGKSSMMSLDENPPEMSKAEAIAELSDFNNVVQTLMQMANGVPPTLPARAVEVTVYTPIARVGYTWKSEKLMITEKTSLRDLIVRLQKMVDMTFRKKDMAGDAGEKYFLHQLEIMIFTTPSIGPLPRISGTPVYHGADRGKF